MYRVTVQYPTPSDPAAFDEHYFSTHAGLVAPIPGLQAFSWSKPTMMGEVPPIYLVAYLDFADEAAMQAGLGSAEMGAAVADLANLPVDPPTIFTGEIVTT